MSSLKDKIVYVCSECGYDQPKWSGKCPSCGAWNSFVEQRTAPEKPASGFSRENRQNHVAGAIPLKHVKGESELRISMPDAELNRVLGGGLVLGSITLIGGEPGIGKSTLILQTALSMQDKKVFYVSGEESARQIKMRADRLMENIGNEMPETLYICTETNLEKIFEQSNSLQPDIIVVDSIQTISSDYADSTAGSISQIKECATSLLKYAKESGIPVILIGHITKEGSIAGPKVLEHIVDTIIQFEGDRQYLYRLLRPVKNRFGSTAEIGIYQMESYGLRPVSNPSELLMNTHSENMSGVSIACTIEGIRPLLIETQALVSSAVYGTPQRSAVGFDIRRLNMLLAVLEKRVGFKLAQKDVFLNIAGGIKVNDPAMDLSVITSVLSSSIDIALDRDICLAGEVGLSGEIRPISRAEQRISEAQRLGFRKIILPASCLGKIDRKKYGIEIVGATKVEQTFKYLFG
ncbi:MAG: DNA repair protein RadA [Bacteroidaceae bacterium]|nr:DNA repair protein RadA [Bacteroidaceae bacterium]